MGAASKIEWTRALRARGHASYADYLRSPAWWTLRARVLERDEHRCRFCCCRARQVHHVVYDLDTLDGKALDTLVSICGSCHEHVDLLAAKLRRDGPKALLAPVRQIRPPAWARPPTPITQGSQSRRQRTKTRSNSAKRVRGLNR